MSTSEEFPAADATLDAPVMACANLTPAIKVRLTELTCGQILEVRSDDPAAREGLPAWSRLTGNPLIATAEDDATQTRFFIRRK